MNRNSTPSPQHPLQQAIYRLQRMSQDAFHVRPILEAHNIGYDNHRFEGTIEVLSKRVEAAAIGVVVQPINPTYEIMVVMEGALNRTAYPHHVREALDDNPGQVVLKGQTGTLIASSMQEGDVYRAALYHPQRTYRLWIERDRDGYRLDLYRTDEIAR